MDEAGHVIVAFSPEELKALIEHLRWDHFTTYDETACLLSKAFDRMIDAWTDAAAAGDRPISSTDVVDDGSSILGPGVV